MANVIVKREILEKSRQDVAVQKPFFWSKEQETRLWEVTNVSCHLAIPALTRIKFGGKACRPVHTTFHFKEEAKIS